MKVERVTPSTSYLCQMISSRIPTFSSDLYQLKSWCRSKETHWCLSILQRGKGGCFILIFPKSPHCLPPIIECTEGHFGVNAQNSREKDRIGLLVSGATGHSNFYWNNAGENVLTFLPPALFAQPKLLPEAVFYPTGGKIHLLVLFLYFFSNSKTNKHFGEQFIWGNEQGKIKYFLPRAITVLPLLLIV